MLNEVFSDSHAFSGMCLLIQDYHKATQLIRNERNVFLLSTACIWEWESRAHSEN